MQTALALALMLPAAAAVAGPATIEVAVRERVQVNRATVRVADVADLAQLHSRDGRLAARVAAVQLAVVRAGQAQLVLDVPTVRNAIQRAAAGQGVALRVTSERRAVVIDAELRPLHPSGAESAAGQALAAACHAVARDCAVHAQTTGEAMQIPGGTVTYRAAPPPRWLDAPSPAQVNVAVLVDGVAVGARRIAVEWKASRDAWQLAKPVVRGQAVRIDDVRPVVVPADQVASAGVAYDARSQLMHAVRDLQAGTVIPAGGAHALAAFRRGESVVVAANVGPVRVHREATTLQNGRAGFAALVEFQPGERTIAGLPPALPAEGER